MKLCSHFVSLAVLFLSAALLTACGAPPDTVEVTQTLERSAYRRPIELNATSEQRFQLALPAQAAQQMSMNTAPGEAQPQLFHWTMPVGWIELPPTSMRLINLQFGANGESEAYLTFLSDGGGGVAMNVNRWRSQMGLEPLTDAEIAALPTKPFFGRDATFVDFEGTYSGMADPTPKSDYRMMGVLLEHGGQGIFLKVVGPKTDMAGQEANLDLLLSSIHLNQDGHSHDHEPVSPAGPMAQAPEAPAEQPGGSGESAGGISWNAPSGWTRTSERPMRLVTYTVGSSECYISVLGPGGGGLLANLNRWLAQFGKPPIDEAALAALPTIKVLGQDAPLLEADGDFTGMDGQTQANQKLLAVACLLPDKSVFIKMTGPAEEVEGERSAFIAFCESLRAE